ncbi:CHAD domain-containing protein [soil metagenome]
MSTVAYRIEPGEPTDVEVRRILAEQLDRAARSLRADGGPDAEAVHDVRKCLKKARSVLRLARSDLGPAVARHANGELRQVGVDLAQQRDADALVEAVDRLVASSDVACPGADRRPNPTSVEALSVVRGLLVERADRVRTGGAVDRRSALSAARTLDQSTNWLCLVPAQATGWAALGPGLTRQYRRGRRAYLDLPEQPSVEALHEWRKRVKDLWYHQRLLRQLWSDAQEPVIATAHELSDLLGDDHDLGSLIAHVGAHHPEIGPDLRLGAAPVEPVPVNDQVRDLVAAEASGERRRLQTRARWLGARLYADAPPAWGERHRAWWEAACQDIRPARAESSTGLDAVLPNAEDTM